METFLADRDTVDSSHRALLESSSSETDLGWSSSDSEAEIYSMNKYTGEWEAGCESASLLGPTSSGGRATFSVKIFSTKFSRFRAYLCPSINSEAPSLTTSSTGLSFRSSCGRSRLQHGLSLYLFFLTLFHYSSINFWNRGIN